MPQTITEKIFSAHAGRPVNADDVVMADLDWVMAHDTTCAWAIDPFEKIAEKVFDPARVIIPFDHAYPAPNVKMAGFQAKIRVFAEAQGIGILTDGVCHQLLAERYITPGDLVLGADSHTPTGGALGALTIGVGSTDMAIAMATGKSWFQVPRTIRINLDGQTQAGVYPKDVILYLAGLLGTERANYHTLEYGGSYVRSLTIPERMTLTNMSAELGTKAATVEPDQNTLDYLREQGRTGIREITALWSDAGCEYAEVINVDVSQIEPMIALPHTVDNVVPLSQLQSPERPISQIFIGSCTNCRIEDLDVVSAIWKGQTLNTRTRIIISPASRQVYQLALDKGYIDQFNKLGVIITQPGCGACLGRHGGVLAPGELCLSTSNRNFQGRMGSPEAEIYLSSPAVAAASAVQGTITHPRDLVHG